MLVLLALIVDLTTSFEDATLFLLFGGDLLLDLA